MQNYKLGKYTVWENAIVTNSKGKIVKGFNIKGYVGIRLSINGKKETYYMHRLMGKFINNPNNLPEINHLSLDKQDNSLTNLVWCTRKENMDHAYANNAIVCKKGEDLTQSKLTEQLVKEIRELSQTQTQKSLAVKYNMHPATINQIVHNKTWKHI